MSEKLKLDLSDPETRLTWESVKRTAAQVAKWPHWKQGVECPSPGSCPNCTPCPHCEGRGYNPEHAP